MALKYRRKLILAKLEDTAGTAEELVKGDAVLAGNIELTPLAGETVSREIEYPYYANSAAIPVNTHMQLAFRVELAGSGAAGTAPAWGKLLQGCGFAETVKEDAQVDYTPVSTGEKTLTLSINIDGQLHTLHGARGTFAIEGGVNQIPYINFTYTGLYNHPSSTPAVANPDYSAFKVPLIGSNTNTPTFSLHGQSSLGLAAFSYDHANEVVHRELIGSVNQVLITDRAPSASLTIDTPAYSDLNLIQRARTTADGTWELVHGTGAGKIVALTAPKTRIASVANQEADGVWQTQLGLALLPSAAGGNDEMKITVK